SLGLTYDGTSQLSPGDNVLPKLPAQTGNGVPIWTINALGNLIAALLEEDAGATTLRSELANETADNDGARLVGYHNLDLGGTTVHTALTTAFQEIDNNANEINDIGAQLALLSTVAYNALR